MTGRELQRWWHGRTTGVRWQSHVRPSILCGRVERRRREFAIPANTEGVALESFVGCASWAEFCLETEQVSTPQFGNHPNAGIRDSHFQFRILGLNTYIQTGC
jgi:hypothetical protein